MLAAPSPQRPQLTRDEIDAVLEALDPVELRSASVRRVGAAGFVTDAVLTRLARRMKHHVPVNGDDTTLLQLGCESGGVGLWLAERRHVQLVSIDPSMDAVEQAMRACGRFHLDVFPTFQRRELADSGVPSGTARSVVSLGAVFEAADPKMVLRESHRVLAIGGLLQFDVFVADDDPDARSWVRTLQQIGFDVLDIDDQTSEWRAVLREQHLSRVHYGSYLVERLGMREAATIITRSRGILAGLDSVRRVELVAVRRRTRQPRGSTGHLHTRLELD